MDKERQFNSSIMVEKSLDQFKIESAIMETDR